MEKENEKCEDTRRDEQKQKYKTKGRIVSAVVYERVTERHPATPSSQGAAPFFVRFCERLLFHVAPHDASKPLATYPRAAFEAALFTYLACTVLFVRLVSFVSLSGRCYIFGIFCCWFSVHLHVHLSLFSSCKYALSVLPSGM